MPTVLPNTLALPLHKHIYITGGYRKAPPIHLIQCICPTGRYRKTIANAQPNIAPYAQPLCLVNIAV